MKIKKDYKLREIADQYVVIPVGEEAIKFNGIISLNKSGKRLFEQLQENKEINELIDYLQSIYDVSLEQATSDVNKFVDILKVNDLLE